MNRRVGTLLKLAALEVRSSDFMVRVQRRLMIRLRGIRYANWGRRTCGYCGYGWRHRSHCPLNGRIARVKDEWYP